jgi:anhydro-N-acetylmuramic acid kinase
MQLYHVIGLMSGTSLDGLDIAYCTFQYKNGKWVFSVKKAVTTNYDNEWLKKLQSAHQLSGENLLKLDNEYGEYLGKQVAKFVKANAIKKVDFVSSHGHTIFHQPKEKFTFQLGNGASIAAACNQSVISDFRSLDVALNGQGAPLVPIGDKLLFSDYDYCINLGGFANISYNKAGKRIAFDICPLNIVLNYLASLKGKQFDKGGSLAATGKVDDRLLGLLNKLNYYGQIPPKSLGREWLENEFMPLIDNSEATVEDKLATVVEHIAGQIAKTITGKRGNVLLTGGGAFNTFLLKQLQKHLAGYKLVVPDNEIVKYKEALIFAFLGVLRYEGKDNCLASVTGADRNNKGGAIYIV